MKKILLVLISIVFALIISEIFLQLIKFKPFISEMKIQFTDRDNFIKWAYLDIHKPFFKIENNCFFIQRQDLWKPRNNTIKYSIKKDSNKKRIFIFGESVARDFKENILQEELSKYLDIEIINIGMGAYDSYRIEKISKELKLLKPDWIVICIGNNDGENNTFNFPKIEPIDINYLPYKYSIFKNSKVLNILSNSICKEIRLNKQDIEPNFQNNIKKIINNLKDYNIIFCDMPNNEYHLLYADLFKSLQIRESDDLYYKNLWKNTFDYKSLISRIDFIKKISDENENIYVTDLTSTLKEYNNDKLDYNIFYDCYHVTDPTYKLLSQIIAKIIIKKEMDIDINISLTKKEYQNLLKANRPFIPYYYIQQCYTLSYEISKIKYKDDSRKFIDENNTIYTNFVNGKSRTYDIYMAIILYSDVLQYNKKNKEAKEILNNMIKIIPKQYEAYLLLGYINYKENNFKQADKYFDIVRELNPQISVNSLYFDSLKNNKIKH